jgi:hypothetical protein
MEEWEEVLYAAIRGKIVDSPAFRKTRPRRRPNIPNMWDDPEVQ